VRGRVWLILGAAAGVAIAFAHVGQFADPARSLANGAQQAVGSGGHRLLASAAGHGVPRTAVGTVAALLVVVVPGVAALLLVVAARCALRLRGLVAILLVGLGVAAYAYQPGRTASEAVVVALVLAGVAVVAAGPVVAAPLCALAGLIGAEFVSRLVANRGALFDTVAVGVHQAVFHTGGSSLALQAGVIILAVVPFVVMARLILSE
jgi:hypothetical protein